MPAFAFQDVIDLELAAARAWPAQRVEGVAGWQVRLSGGGARRANSVLPIGHDGSDVEQAIEATEALYRADGLPSYFQVSSASGPADLDARLAARAYVAEEPCLLMAKQLTACPEPADVVITEAPSDAWFSVYAEWLDAARKAAAPATLARAPGPKAFFLVSTHGQAVATALGVLDPDSGIVIVECVATRTDQRRTGAARIIMNALENWALSQGGSTAALQVVEHNAPAIALYTQRGYAIAGRYHYRWKRVQPVSP